MPYYERLSAADALFLALEDASNHMHVGGVFVFDLGPLRNAHGGLDIERVRASIESRMPRVPRFRQRLADVPGEGHPVWVDDDRFHLPYHVRHSALPRPGDVDTLKRLVGRIMSQQLDRGKPLWEMWFVEGLEEDRFALVTKTHHCMIDGVAGAELMSVILDAVEKPALAAPKPWLPRPAPTSSLMVGEAVMRRLAQPFEAAKAVADAVRDPRHAYEQVREAVEGIGEMLAPSFRSASPTPFNVPCGPHRRFELVSHRVRDFKAVKDALGGTLNDVVLATVAGALRNFLLDRGIPIQDMEIRAMVPVSVRAKSGEGGHLGNQITQMVAPLPVPLSDPIERLKCVRETMGNLKESKQALGGRVLTAVAEWTVPNVLVQAVRMSVRSRPYNLVVTNVPGPQIPLYLLGCRMRESYPVAPLSPGQALNVALFSYDGGLFWGLNADYDAIPDLAGLGQHIRDAFSELQQAAGVVSE